MLTNSIYIPFCFGRKTAAALAASLVSLAIFLSSYALGGEQDWDVYSDTWGATDALGRTLPQSSETGPPRADRTVALFYFLWLGRHGESGPYDISEILKRDPSALGNKANPLWGPLGAPHHWGESVFGHYLSDDEAILRKHAQMLGDAGVDVIVFDVTNQFTYPESWRALGRVFSEERAKGNRTPQIAFLCPFWEPAKVVKELYRELYQPGLYRDLWFHWEGKPLILADPKLEKFLTLGKSTTPVRLRDGETLRQTVRITSGDHTLGACLPTWEQNGSGALLTLKQGAEVLVSKRFTNLSDNSWATLEVASIEPGDYTLELSDPVGTVGWWSDGKQRMVRTGSTEKADSDLLDFFTFRKPQPDYFQGPTGPNQWSWLEVYPQHVFRDSLGRPEQMSVGVAQNAVAGKLSVLSNPRSHGRSFHQGIEPGPEGWTHSGLNFAEQWKRAHEVDPPVIFITGWNEWIAGRFDESSPFFGGGPVTFVDQFSQEFSRDIEPMKGGHGDTYYYQMVDGIRRYKGTRSLPPVVSQPITVDGNFDDWSEVTPEFRDTLGDPVKRDHRGWGKELRYVETSGRNDLVAAKVSADAEKIYFHIRTAEDLSDPTSERWMWLFLDTNDDPQDGWLGFDYLIGRNTVDGSRSLERADGNGFAWKETGRVNFAMKGAEMELEVPRAALGIGPGPFTLRFKWADNIKGTGDWSDFTLHGDCAPNDRFTYEAKFECQEVQASKTADASVSFHVDPRGDDANPGTSEQPFATLERARDAIREQRRASGRLPPGGVTVILAGGTHSRTAAFELMAEDSGEEDAPIVYASAPGKRSVLFGGTTLQSCQFLPVEDAVLLERLICPLARKKLRVCDLKAHGIEEYGQLKRRGFALPTPPPPLGLFVDGVRMPLARYPNEGHLRMTRVVDKGPVQADADFQTRGGGFICDDERLKHWTAAEEVWLNGVFSKDWAWSFNRISNLDPQTGTITLAHGEIYGILKWNQDFFYAENLLEELDAPGEYFLDRLSGKLYLIPPERFEEARITVSTLEGPMVHLENARHVTFRDLVFDTGREYAIKGNGQAVRVESCEFVRLGLGAVGLKGSQNMIDSCHIHHIGGTAIGIEGGDWQTLAPSGTEVRNCLIHDWGYWQRVYCPAVILSGVGHVVRQNTFKRFPHTAIIVYGNDHLIEGNWFAEGPIDFKDMGAIYGNLGQAAANRGTVIRGNLFENIASQERQNAVYPDNGTMEWVIEQNIFLRCGNQGQRPMGAVFSNGGAYLTLRDNIFVDCVVPFRLSFFLATWAQAWRPDYEAKWQKLMEQHDFAAMPHGQRYPGLLRLLEEDRVFPDTNIYERNLVWNPTVPLASEEAFITEGGPANLVKAANNLIATDNPGFVDWQHMNFTLAPEAPVFKHIPGFKVFDFSRIGARGPLERAKRTEQEKNGT